MSLKRLGRWLGFSLQETQKRGKWLEFSPDWPVRCVDCAWKRICRGYDPCEAYKRQWWKVWKLK